MKSCAVATFVCAFLATNIAHAESAYCAKSGPKKIAAELLTNLVKRGHVTGGEYARRQSSVLKISKLTKLHETDVNIIESNSDSLKYIALGQLGRKRNRTSIAFLWPHYLGDESPVSSGDRITTTIYKNGKHSLGVRIHICHYDFPIQNAYDFSGTKFSADALGVSRNSTTIRIPGKAKPWTKQAQRFQNIGDKRKVGSFNQLHVIFIRAESKRRKGSFWLLTRRKVGKGQPSAQETVLRLAKRKCVGRSGRGVFCELVNKIENAHPYYSTDFL
jgi:hypothetical protein